MKLLFTLFIGLISFCANAQEGELLLDVKSLPVKDGRINGKQQKFCHGGGPIDGVEIISTTDSVFAVSNGMVTYSGLIADNYAVIIKVNKSQFHCFSNLKSSPSATKEIIKKGDFIGLIKLDEENALTLNFMITDGNGTPFGENKTVSFLKKVNPIVCYAED